MTEPLTIWQVHRDILPGEKHGVVASFHTLRDAEDFVDLVTAEQPDRSYWILIVAVTGRPMPRRKTDRSWVQ